MCAPPAASQVVSRLLIAAGRGRTATRWLVVARNEGILLDDELTIVVILVVVVVIDDAVAALIRFGIRGGGEV